jgi:hypothetical protein
MFRKWGGGGGFFFSTVYSTTGETRVRVNQLADYLQAKNRRFPTRSFCGFFVVVLIDFVGLPARLNAPRTYPGKGVPELYVSGVGAEEEGAQRPARVKVSLLQLNH